MNQIKIQNDMNVSNFFFMLYQDKVHCIYSIKVTAKTMIFKPSIPWKLIRARIALIN